MKKYFLFLIPIFTIFFYGCSNETVTVPMVVKPNYISINKSKQIRKIKISKFKNDNIGLTNKVIREMKYINTIIPDYFYIKSSKKTSSIIFDLEEDELLVLYL